MRKILVAMGWVAAFATVGCGLDTGDSVANTSAIEHELIGGEIDDGDPAAVALLSSSGDPFCSGTLISPSVVATAAHCLDDAGNDPNVTAFFGTDPYGQGRKVSIGMAQAHLMWNGNLSNGHDIALARLNFAQDVVPIPINAVESMADHLGDPVRRIGFGIYTVEGLFDGKKRVGTAFVTAMNPPDQLIAGGGTANTCSGDSGGSVVMELDGVEHLVGVHSFGSQVNGQCVPGNDGDTRVELFADDFVIPWIEANDPACGLDGTCYKIGCQDDPDCEPCGADGECFTDCPLPDPDCTTQGLGELCQADTQCTTGMCVFWLSEPRTKFCTESCDPANDACPEGMSCRTVGTFENICYYDDDPAGILGDECTEHTDCGSYICEEGKCVYACDLGAGEICPIEFECSSTDGNQNYYCHTLDDGGGGGCSTTGRQSGATALLLIALGVLRRRRSLRIIP